MTLRSFILTAVAGLFLTAGAFAQESKEAAMQRKAVEVISQMTLDEKISMMMNSTPGVPRLGIKPYDWWSEALHGVARSGKATVFPEPIGLGATFDPELIKKIGNVRITAASMQYYYVCVIYSVMILNGIFLSIHLTK